MIKSKLDYKFYLKADQIALGLPNKFDFLSTLKEIINPNYVWRFQKKLREIEYLQNCKTDLISLIRLLIVKYFFKRLSIKLGFTIPPNVFGAGLSIAHYGTIIVNRGAKIGENCRVHACVNIGTKAGYSNKAPSIGNNCYIGPGAKIYGEILIPDGISIGANSVVNKSFHEKNIAIAGVPAKKIANVDPFDFIIPATKIINSNYLKDIDIHNIPAKFINDKYIKSVIDD